MALSVQAPDLACIGSEENDQQQKQGQSVETRPEVAPDRHSVTCVPPGSQGEIQQKNNPQHAARSHTILVAERSQRTIRSPRPYRRRRQREAERCTPEKDDKNSQPCWHYSREDKFESRRGRTPDPPPCTPRKAGRRWKWQCAPQQSRRRHWIIQATWARLLSPRNRGRWGGWRCQCCRRVPRRSGATARVQRRFRWVLWCKTE